MRKVINEASRPDPELVEGFRSLLLRYSPSCIISDVMERARTMHSALIPASPGRFAGPALTVRLYPGDLVDCLDALRVAQAGDVIVVDAAGETETSIWGGLMAGLCLQKGVAGAVVDGAVRDVDEVRDLGFPLVARAIVPRSTHSPYSNRLEPIEINVPIVCGGSLVNPGDIVLADEIGVVAVPQEEAASVLERALAQAEMEEVTRQRINAGKTVDELLAEFGRL
ncbi:MAG: RraA family protein [Actinobacteria bacterium]|nr:RraA family protein [Actinomycetota bacterium]